MIPLFFLDKGKEDQLQFEYAMSMRPNLNCTSA